MASTWKIHLTVVYLSVLFVLANAESTQITTVGDISYILGSLLSLINSRVAVQRLIR